MLTLETRVKNLENAFNGLIKTINNNKFYSDADTQGVRQSVSEVTPYTESITAYIEDTQVAFFNVPDGNLSVFVKDDNGDFPKYEVSRDADIVKVSFEPLKYITTVTISVQ